ncbi:EF-hand calcium-binding domain-containing protein 6 [Plakobranchus ocellatus]|uniref:EF-hand calcium-binding domain-containing protein 6 n=1 Tax=Plakobranchus ocellatus TaxID=259542 RepID=A0AAV3ZQX2_9GAST|nr:EF-hand calcium-binding domain-containing protein 6 [Plakobranchus ocellatus]
MTWKHPSSPVTKKFKVQRSAAKVMATVFWDAKGVILLDILPQVQCINAARYCSTLDRLKEAIRRKRPGLLRRGVVLQHDNATPHSANLTQQWRQRYGWEILPHPAHSLDLAPPDFHLFGPLKRHLGGMAFETEDDLISKLRNWFDNLDVDFFRSVAFQHCFLCGLSFGFRHYRGELSPFGRTKRDKKYNCVICCFPHPRGQAPSLYGPRPDMVDPMEEKMPAPPTMSERGGEENMDAEFAPLPTAAVADVDMEELHRRRTPQELFKVIKDLMTRRFQDVEQRFYDLDDTNTRRLTQEMMYHLLRSFDIRPEISRGEIRDLWRTFITNTDRTLDYLQFIRHFGFSMRSATFPNAKLHPPRRGDADFMIRSRKLNCAADMLQDNLRAKVDYLWDDLRREFVNMDPYNTGFVTKEEFREVLTELCVNLSNLELEQLISKFEARDDGRVSYIEFLKPFALRKQIWRHGNNMLSLLQHPQPELPIADIVEPPQKGLHGITAKLRQKLAGDWKNLRRAFRKLDVTGNGYLSLPEFRSVLKLANVILDEDEVYHVMTEFDRDLSGKISYEKFIEETFKPETKQSARGK